MLSEFLQASAVRKVGFLLFFWGWCVWPAPVSADSGVPEPPLTLDLVYPELRENAERSVYFELADFPRFEIPGRPRVSAWIESLRPHPPDARKGFVQVWPLSDDAMFVKIQAPDAEEAGNRRIGVAEIYKIEPRTIEYVHIQSRREILFETEIGVAKWACHYDEEGRTTERIYYRWGFLERGWVIAKKEKLAYWPGGDQLRSISYHGYPGTYSEDVPERVEEYPKDDVKSGKTRE